MERGGREREASEFLVFPSRLSFLVIFEDVTDKELLLLLIKTRQGNTMTRFIAGIKFKTPSSVMPVLI